MVSPTFLPSLDNALTVLEQLLTLASHVARIFPVPAQFKMCVTPSHVSGTPNAFY